MDEKAKRDIALFRVAVLGPLVGARLEHGDLAAWCQAAAERTWALPDGRAVRVSARTVENWFYRYRYGGFEALHPKDRKDLGTSEIPAALADLVVRAKREKPRRSIRRIIRMLERARKVPKGELSESAVHRLLQRHRISARPKRGPTAERRSFLTEHPDDLWIGDVLHVHHPVLGPDGRRRKTYLLSQLDCATRYLTHSYFAFSEDAPAQEYGLKQALLAHGRPAAFYVDRGSAYIAGSLKAICAELIIRLIFAADAEAKGAIERWHRTWREEVEDELPDRPVTLEELESKHRAWLACDYHAREHDTTKRIPKDHWLELVEHLRPLPREKNLDEVFLHRATRTVRGNGTVRWGGGYLEVHPELHGKVELRFDPTRPEALPKVFVEGRFACDTVPLDLYRNATRERRRDLGKPEPQVEPTGIDPLALLEQEHYRLTRPDAALAASEETDDEDDPDQT